MAAKKKAFFAKNCEKMARFQKFIVKKKWVYMWFYVKNYDFLFLFT